MLVIDNSRLMTEEEEKVYKEIYHRFHTKIIAIHHKEDLHSQAPHIFTEYISSSSVKPETIHAIHVAIHHRIKQLFDHSSSPLFT